MCGVQQPMGGRPWSIGVYPQWPKEYTLYRMLCHYLPNGLSFLLQGQRLGRHLLSFPLFLHSPGASAPSHAELFFVTKALTDLGCHHPLCDNMASSALHPMSARPRTALPVAIYRRKCQALVRQAVPRRLSVPPVRLCLPAVRDLPAPWARALPNLAAVDPASGGSH
ncbi:hypothetical protein OH77DRAFT_1209795 [Trametes cingulata]|nr:hypothetical protein OH77DRAFT_1209795 [Trametes cingulata]